MKKAIVVVIEGVDGVGKTTLAQRLSKEFGFFYLYTPQPPLTLIRKDIEILNNPKTRFFYYLTSVIAVQDLIDEKLSKNISVVIDRYIYSTFIMHKQLGVDVSCVQMKYLPIHWPDVGILLTAETKIREARIANRGCAIRHDTSIEQLSLVLDRTQVGYKEFSELQEIDSSILTVNQVFDVVCNLIEIKN